jgi:hypothetical protein
MGCTEHDNRDDGRELTEALPWTLLRRSASGDDLTKMHATASSGMSSASSDADHGFLRGRAGSRVRHEPEGASQHARG